MADLLVVAALLHDIGKGHQGDHSTTGMMLTREIVTRMGFPPDDVSTLVALVENHLLLPDVATRRDLDDPTTINRVAAVVATAERLHLLAALTEADGLATGPSAWDRWKAGLVNQLVERAAHVLDGNDIRRPSTGTFPSQEQLARLAAPGQHIEAAGQVLTIMTADHPGIFSRVAGVLALHGLDVLRADAYSSDNGRALAQFSVSDAVHDHIPWARVIADLELVLDGRLALTARLTERARTYWRNHLTHAVTDAVNFDNHASASATVIDVHTRDRIGVLYRITRALAELDLDIRSATVRTLGPHVVDSFYVRDQRGAKLGDSERIGEIKRAILHSLAE